MVKGDSTTFLTVKIIVAVSILVLLIWCFNKQWAACQRCPSHPNHINIYNEPERAGEGSFEEELKRFITSLRRQGAVCLNIRHFGGFYKQVTHPPEYGPDGAWFLCLDPEVSLNKNSCIVYSAGIANEWSFDDSMSEYGCQVYSFDARMHNESYFRSQKIQFFDIGLSDVDMDGKPGLKKRTLKTIIKDLGHEKKMLFHKQEQQLMTVVVQSRFFADSLTQLVQTGYNSAKDQDNSPVEVGVSFDKRKKPIDVLKIDTRGDEWKSLPQMMADGTLKSYVRQLDVQFYIHRIPLRRSYGILEWLDRQGFKIVYTHKNMYRDSCFQAAFINSNLVNLTLR